MSFYKFTTFKFKFNAYIVKGYTFDAFKFGAEKIDFHSSEVNEAI